MTIDRRRFLGIAGAAALTFGPWQAQAAREDVPARKVILVWGDAADVVAATLTKLPGGYAVRVVAPGDAEQGLSQASLDTAAVLVWCKGNSATPQQGEVSAEIAARIVRAGQQGGMGIVSLGMLYPTSTLFRALFPQVRRGDREVKKDEAATLLHVTEPHYLLARGVRDFALPGGVVRGEDQYMLNDGYVFPFAMRGGAKGTNAEAGVCWLSGKGRVLRFMPDPVEISKRPEGRRILRNAVLWVARDEAAVFEDADPSARAARGAGEPPLALILRDAGYGGTDVTAGGEAAVPLLVKAGPGPVKVTLLAAYGVAKTSRGGWYTPGDPVRRTELWQVPPENNKQMHPPLAPGSKTEFDPGSAPFGIWIASDGFPGEFIYTEDAQQAAISRFGKNHHKAHVYAAVKSVPSDAILAASANPDPWSIPNAYIMGFEYSTNDDNQEAVLLVENVRAR